MNNKKNIRLLIFLLIGCSCYAQYKKQAFDIVGGYESEGYYGRAAYNTFVGEKHMIRLSGQVHFENYEIGENNENIDVNLYLGNIEYYYQILDVNGRDVLVYAGLGGLGGYEDIKENTLSDGSDIIQESGFVYGGHIGVEIEKYLFEISKTGNSLALIIATRQNFFIKSELGDTQFNASLGLRFNF